MRGAGTHPELIHLTKVIETRRERRQKLVELWFEQQQSQYARVAKAEEAMAWSHWRNATADLRREQMDDVSRKRRKLEREKRLLDAPRPARRYQLFQTEVIRNPEWQPPTAAQQQQQQSYKGKGKRRATTQPDFDDETGAYVAFPDLRGLDEPDAWQDMEHMGVSCSLSLSRVCTL